MVTPEPILDIVRALSTVASTTIIFKQVRNVWDEIFTSRCAWCRGAGKVTCPHCRGTKALRKYPARIKVEDGKRGFVEAEEDFYPCYHCGPPTKYDFDEEIQDEEGEAVLIQDNFKAALANKLRPNKFRCWAGTVPCPQCQGSVVIRRHTPNFEGFLKFEHPWDFMISQRIGYYNLLRKPAAAAAAAPVKAGHRKYLEYPSKPPALSDVMKGSKGAGPKAKEDKGVTTMSAKDQFGMDDYVLNYVDEES